MEQLGWLRRLDDEQDHLRTALAWTLSEGEAELALRLSGGLTQFWQIRGRFTEGLSWLTAALALQAAPGDRGPLDFADARRSERLRARALWGVGFMNLMRSDLLASREALDQCLVLARDLADVGLEARALLLSGNGLMVTDRFQAIEQLARSADLARCENDSWCLALALSLSGRIQLLLGDAGAALSLLEECLRVAHANGDQQTLCAGLTVMSEHALVHSDRDAALALLGENVRVARLLGEPCLVVLALQRLGRLRLELGDHGGARSLLEEALLWATELEGPSQQDAIQSSLKELATAMTLAEPVQRAHA